MRLKLCAWCILALCGHQAYGQLPLSNFAAPASVCLNETLPLVNSSSNATDYEWDFCEGDLFASPTATLVTTISSSFNPSFLEIVYDGAQYYGFVVSRGTNAIYRVDFGTDLSSTPSVTNLGNPGSLLSGPEVIKLVTEGGNWYGIVLNNTSQNLVRISFGSSLNNDSPSASVAATGTGTGNGCMDLGVSSQGITAVIGSLATHKVQIVNFGNSITNNPTAGDMITSAAIVGMSAIDDITIQFVKGNWHAFVVGFNSRTVHRLDFGSNLFSLPTTTQLSGVNFGTDRPTAIHLGKDKGSFVIMSSTNTGNVYRIDLGNSILTTGPSVINLGNFSTTTSSVSFRLVKWGSSWTAFNLNASEKQIHRLNFPNPCSLPTSTEQLPLIVQYPTAGTYHISLTAGSGSYDSDYSSVSIAVIGSLAPDITFNSQNVCANHNIDFTSMSSSGDITDYLWDFGDTNSSILQNPSHQYSAAGDYPVTLNVTSINGCKNFIQQSLSVFDPPIADFALPAPSQFCTNQLYQFLNTSTTDPGYPSVSWQWLVNGIEQSQAQDFDFIFTSTSSQDVTLTASIPGCSDQQTRSISTLAEGPITSYTFTGQCQFDDIVFTNNSSGDITGYQWDFGDGQYSIDENPVHNYSSIGAHEVMLTVTSPSGCNNSYTLPVITYSKPAVDFLAELPPFSCSGTDTYLKDQTPGPTDSNLNSWNWNFGDPGSSQNTSILQNPSHIYALAGDYTVDLTVTTDKGCSSNVQKLITVLQTPLIDFTSSPACKNVLTQFNDQTQEAVAWTWNINGTNYTNQAPLHTFATAGTKNISLHVVSINGCEASTATQVVVPEPLVPAFATLKTCANESAEFTDVTVDTTDPIVNRKWIFLTQEFSTASPTINHTFVSTGNIMVTMEVEASSGCKYTKTSNVTILDKPFSSFTATPIQGGAPLPVQFSNKSTGATSYLWEFGDSSESTSTALSPSFTYQDQGVFEVKLHASNDQQCSSTSSQFITANTPVIDAAITQLDLSTISPGTLRPVITLVNNGNVPLSGFRLVININNETRLAEQILTTIPVSGLYQYEMPFDILQAGVTFVCAELVVANDSNPANNRNCNNIDRIINVLTPYPNPADEELLVEWITQEESGAEVRMTNSLGEGIAKWAIAAREGLNQLRIDTEFFPAGLYILTIETQLGTKSVRVIVEH